MFFIHLFKYEIYILEEFPGFIYAYVFYKRN